jgi:hypothetical protein
MVINDNSSKWAGESPDSIDVLMDELSREPLNPTFEKYGNFVLPHDDGTVRVWGNFYNVSHVFSVDGTPEELHGLITAVRANQKTAAYRAAREAKR